MLPDPMRVGEVVRIDSTTCGSRRSRIEISDVTVADEFLEGAYGVLLRLAWRVDRPAGPLLKHRRVTVGPLTLDELYSAGCVEAAPDPLGRFSVVWAHRGRIEGTCATLSSSATAGGITAPTQPDLPHRVRSEDLHAATVLLDPALIAGVATGLPSGQGPLPVRFTSLIPVDAASEQVWKTTVRYAVSVLADDVAATPLVLGELCRLLAAATLAAFPNTATGASSPFDRADHAPTLLRRAIEYIESNVGNDIGVADIADAVRVTPRAVQYMFRRHLDITPLQYLRRLRLHCAHQDLLAADPTIDTVAGIAARWGFAHTGRFAALYRQTYGQSPHTTLRNG